MPDLIILAMDVPDAIDILNTHVKASNFVTGQENDYEYLIVTQPEHLDGVALPLNFLSVLVSRNFFRHPLATEILNKAYQHEEPPMAVEPPPEEEPEGTTPPEEEVPAEEPDTAEPVEEVDPTTQEDTGTVEPPPGPEEPNEPPLPEENYPEPTE